MNSIIISNSYVVEHRVINAVCNYIVRLSKTVFASVMLSLSIMLFSGVAKSSSDLENDVVVFNDGYLNTLHLFIDEKTGQYIIPDSLKSLIEFQQEKTGIKNLKSDNYEQGISIKSVIIDTGVLNEHPDIKPYIVETANFTDEDNKDMNGHGTAVTLIYLAHAGKADLYIAKALDSSGRGSYKSMMDAIEWGMSKNDSVMVMNISAGKYFPCIPDKRGVSGSASSCENLSICKLAEKARNNGVLISAAVGNTPGKTACPACCKSVMAVGNEKSNTGADIIAPTNVQ